MTDIYLITLTYPLKTQAICYYRNMLLDKKSFRKFAEFYKCSSPKKILFFLGTGFNPKTSFSRFKTNAECPYPLQNDLISFIRRGGVTKKNWKLETMSQISLTSPLVDWTILYFIHFWKITPAPIGSNSDSFKIENNLMVADPLNYSFYYGWCRRADLAKK